MKRMSQDIFQLGFFREMIIFAFRWLEEIVLVPVWASHRGYWPIGLPRRLPECIDGARPGTVF